MNITEDKNYWCRRAVFDERDFVNRIAPQYGLDIQINPDKNGNKYAPDLLYEKTVLADLKKQSTPFFTSDRYGVDPQYCVTFNEKDYIRYKEKYPEIIIFFWVQWEQSSYPYKKPTMFVGEQEGIWMVSFETMCKMIDSGAIPLHAYKRRVNDNKNAKTSFLFDLNDFTKLEIV